MEELERLKAEIKSAILDLTTEERKQLLELIKVEKKKRREDRGRGKKEE